MTLTLLKRVLVVVRCFVSQFEFVASHDYIEVIHIWEEWKEGMGLSQGIPKQSA